MVKIEDAFRACPCNKSPAIWGSVVGPQFLVTRNKPMCSCKVLCNVEMKSLPKGSLPIIWGLLATIRGYLGSIKDYWGLIVPKVWVGSPLDRCMAVPQAASLVAFSNSSLMFMSGKLSWKSGLKA